MIADFDKKKSNRAEKDHLIYSEISTLGKYFHLPRLKRLQGDFSIPREAVQQIERVTLIPES